MTNIIIIKDELLNHQVSLYTSKARFKVQKIRKTQLKLKINVKIFEFKKQARHILIIMTIRISSFISFFILFKI
jgi:hypothetical protein